MLIAILGGVFLGFISGMKQGSFLDLFCMIGAVTGRSIPSFWLGLMLIYLLSVKLNILPSGGYGGGNILYLILPAFSLGIGYMALIARVTRASVIDVMNEDYIRTARSKGLSEFVIRYKHIFKNALIPVITIIGLQFGGLIAATVVIEKVFSLPGIGSLLIQSIYRRDVALVQGCILLIIFSFLIINFVIDILYAYIDPRIRYQ
jgi:peptide/nickel transport system permease protein